MVPPWPPGVLSITAVNAPPSAAISAAAETRTVKTTLNGAELVFDAERGTLLRGGDCLLASDGRVIEVIAAPETVSVVTADDPWGLARAAYHLGNRHISVQVGQGWLRYLHDHVLDDMVRGLGFTVTMDELPFEPEAGAYSHSGAGNTHHHSFVLSASHPHAHG